MTRSIDSKATGPCAFATGTVAASQATTVKGWADAKPTGCEVW